MTGDWRHIAYENAGGFWLRNWKEGNIINFLSHGEAMRRGGGTLLDDNVTGAITVISKVLDFLFLAIKIGYILT
jgi:hypothetical protein